MNRVAALHEFRNCIRRVLDPLVAESARCALVGFPHHDNVGDSLIWLGELSYLSEASVEIGYMCDRHTYSARALKNCLGTDGLILIHGGGNFGDLWPPEQELRERVITDFPSSPIVQLPQSIHFEEERNLQRVRRILDSHPSFTLLVRERQSQQMGSDELGVEAHMCPDMALMMPALTRHGTPDFDVVWLSRTDREARGEIGRPDSNLTVNKCDWVGGAKPPQGYTSLSRRALGAAKRRLVSIPAISRRLDRPQPVGYLDYAERQLARGSALLARSRLVITDRLHGHILSLLLGIPHILLDNSYGKLSRFYESWSTEIDGVWWADSASDALRLADTLLSRRE